MPNSIVIPTPQECNFTGKTLCSSGFKLENAPLAAPYALKMGQALLKESASIKLILGRLEHENRQAYKIRIREREITVDGASRIAFVYAMSTLLQLAKIENGRITLPEADIFDYPKFAWRGVNWNLLVEARAWSQDAGDGLDAFVERFINGLDILAFFKLNVAFVDGFGWNSERFDGYGKLMRKLNRAAAERGIKLIFGGYNAGYGAQWYDYDGRKFQNRKSYPDGEPYSCLGYTWGTCLSNKALREGKKNDLREFVSVVEPGMLYVHGIDLSTQPQAEKAWNERCPECRKRWPNDAVNAADGMAGAFAEFYSDLYEAVAGVKNSSGDYDAARDCIVNMVSPNYTRSEENDEEWQYHLEYFKTLYGCLKSKNIHLTLREQFFNCADDSLRFKQLRKTVGENCKLSVVYFSSGSTFYNTLPVAADAACIKYFDGMDVVIAGSGNAFQEPRQAIYAEYMWNPEGSAFQIDLPERGSNDEFLPYYHDLSNGRILPEAVFGENGLLKVVCEKLYGKKAGTLVEQTQRPELVPVRDLNDNDSCALAPLAPIFNDLLPGYYFSVFSRNWKGKEVFWRAELTEDIIEYAGRGAKLMPHLIRVSDAAAVNYGNAASLCESELPVGSHMRKKHLERMAETCSTGARLAGFAQRWLQILIAARECMQKATKSEDLQTSIKILCKDINSFAEPLRTAAKQAIDPNGADIGQAVRTIDFILGDLTNIRHTLATNEYPKAQKTGSWW